MSGISREEWLTALGGAVEQPEPGALTVKELAIMCGRSERAMLRRVSELEASGRVRRTWKYVTTAQTNRLRVAAFVLIDSANKGKRAAR